MRHHHDGAVEVAERFGQCFAHFQVEVVGGFVQQQHVGLLPGDQRQRQARTFAAGESIHGLERAVAGEIPFAQEIAERLVAGIRRQIAEMVHRRLALMQRLHRVLGEVTDAQVRVRHAVAGHRRQFAHQRLHQRGLARAVGAEQADALARLQAEADIVQDHRIGPITGFDVVQADQRERQLGRLGELDAELALGAHRLGAGQLGQALHAALRLRRLGGLGLEAVDEALQVGALGLLLLVGDLLLAQLLGALALKIGVAAGIQLGAAAVQVQGVGGDVVEELAVVRDQQQRAGILQQPLLQPEHRVHVEVVGGFVEQQQVAGHHQRARQVQAHAPAAGERRHRPRVRIGREAQAVQQLARARFGIVGTDLGHLLVRVGDRLPVLARGGLGLGLQHRGHLGVAAEHERQRRIRQRRGFLRHAGDAHLAGQVQVALVGLQFALHGGEQAGLARTVATHHADAVTRMQGEVDVGQQQALTTAEREITKGNQETTYGDLGGSGRVVYR